MEPRQLLATIIDVNFDKSLEGSGARPPSGPIEVNGFSFNLPSREKGFTIEKDLLAISGLNRFGERFAQIDVTLEAGGDLAPIRTVLDYRFTDVVLRSIKEAVGESRSTDYGFSYASLTTLY
jgi:hypothetical protein